MKHTYSSILLRFRTEFNQSLGDLRWSKMKILNEILGTCK